MFLFFFGFFFSHGYFRWSVGYKQALYYVVGIEKKSDNSQKYFYEKLWIPLHLRTLPSCISLMLLWYRLNVKPKIQEIRELMN